ncbi:MAG: acyl-CoA dehydratase activase [Candidatus Thermoplasmatota archaeon]|jgi:predicted CoA-substrate-specific enzyme activase|nr:acyl-CoA dehydratase activase [Candidatus Thermoplasmatota archaeon]
MITAGLDIGTRNSRAILLEDGTKILAKARSPTGYDMTKVAQELLASALASAGLTRADIDYVAVTGFGRYRYEERDLSVTEITAAARGAKFLFPRTTCVLDVGAGNARASKVDEKGKIVKFRSTEKCAAGGGGFLEKIAFYSQVGLESLGPLALTSKNPVAISTVCSVLAESEVINLITQEVPLEDILMGANQSVVGRVYLTLKQVGINPEVTLTGGLVENPAFVKAFETKLGSKLNSSPDLYYAAALGAAYLGHRRLLKRKGVGA